LRKQHLKEDSTSIVKRNTFFKSEINSGKTPLTHNIGATLGLCHMFLNSWINSDNHTIIPASTKTKPGQVIHPKFELKLPGTKTKLFLKTASDDNDWQLIIYDELMNYNYDHTHDQPSLSFPYASDPHVAGIILALLEYSSSGKLSKKIKSLEVESSTHELKKPDLLTVYTLTLRAIKVTGKKNITNFSRILHDAFILNKGNKIPLEDGLNLPLIDTQNTLTI
jgi:hypothetical protein